MKQNREPKNKARQLWSINLMTKMKEDTKWKRQSLQYGA